MILTDSDLINQIKTDPAECADSYGELINRHKNLYNNIARRITSGTTGSFKDDLFEDHSYVLNLAIQSYDVNRNTKFSTWFANMARWHCLNAIGEAKRKDLLYFSPIPEEKGESGTGDNAKISLDTMENFSIFDHDPIDLTCENQQKENDILDMIAEHKDPRIVEIAKLRIQGIKMLDIAKRLDLTKEYCSHIYRKALEEIFGKNLNLCSI